MSWPAAGDRATFRRRMGRHLALGALPTVLLVTAASLTDPSLAAPLLVLGSVAVLLVALWAHGSARAAARRAEVLRSFAGLAVIHHGQAFEIPPHRALLGEFASRRQAVGAALDRGGWAVVVRAWDRYYVLRGAPALDVRGRRPVTFRSRAVADVVPAVRDGVALGA